MEKNTSVLDENWQVLKGMFPKNWEALARETGASRRLRGFHSVEDLLRTLLLHIARGYSLRETAVQGKAAGFATVSDVALLKRLRNSRHWLRELCLLLLEENGAKVPAMPADLRIKMVDATVVKEPGKTGSQWRIHYCLQMPQLVCDHFELSPTEGKGHGESFEQFPVQRGDHIIGDRGYSTAQGIEYIDHKKGYVLVRVNTGALPLFSSASEEQPFSLLKCLENLKTAGEIGEWNVWVQGQRKWISGRLCVIRKSEHAIALAHKKLKQKAIKRATTLKPQTLEYAKYIMVFTTFSEERFSAAQVLEWYRLRWQIELMFKRLKSLAELGHLPKYDAQSSQAWLYGKLFVGLLTEKLVQIARDISPWGYFVDSSSTS